MNCLLSLFTRIQCKHISTGTAAPEKGLTSHLVTEEANPCLMNTGTISICHLQPDKH